jgi:hypothetical protein
LPGAVPFTQRNLERQRDLRQSHTMDLVHEQHFTLARSKQAGKLVIIYGLLPRTMDRAAEDLRVPGIVHLV